MAPAIAYQFNGNFQEFDSTIARKLANLIQQAYKKQFPAWDEFPNSPNWTPDQPFESFELVELFTQKVPFGFVAFDPDSRDIFVVFRGTLKYIEWFKNTKIALVSYQNGQESLNEDLKRKEDIAEGIKFNDTSENIGEQDFGRVTAGFRGMYVAFRNKMIETLKTLPQDSKIYVTGHSLGGAFATLAIPDILQNTQFKSSQITLYTFASPRCGDREFATKFTETSVQHWRIANTEDFVTTIPFPTGNVFKPTDDPKTPLEPEIGSRGTKGNPNPFFGFLKDLYSRNKRRMPDYVHTGTPICFTIHDHSLEQQHNLDKVYMEGINQDPLPNPKSLKE